MDSHDPRQRLLALADEHRVSLSQLSKMIGRNGTYLQQFVRKGSPRKLEETDRRTLARFFGIDESALGAPEEISSKEADAKRWSEVPRLALGASAGPGSLGGEELPFDALRFSTRWLRAQGFEPASLSAIAVTGDSMEPTLRDGDEILVQRGGYPLRDGIHVVRVDDALLVKRLETGRPGVLTLISDNPSYRPIELPRDDVAVIGRVVWKGGRL
jgi:phage repressor protein C with HTH and peptisase S24 domain